MTQRLVCRASYRLLPVQKVLRSAGLVVHFREGGPLLVHELAQRDAPIEVQDHLRRMNRRSWMMVRSW